ncbi:MAG TPA: acyloxyacyl hydrolase [Stellaceae bacterium]|nr:acyloxyacyl hydrolase [Stellaceae bacterium]
MSAIAKHFLAAAMLVAVALVARPAAAQIQLGPISIGSPDGPQRLAFGAGAFDITPGGQKYAGTQGVFRGEYHFGDVLIPLFSPFIGLDVTTKGGTYTYAGFGFDVNFGPNWVLTPNGAAGDYQRGDGTKLGSWMEFRSGAEFDYKFADQSRLGVSFQHTSNAGLTKFNPGEQEVLLVYQLPLHW